MKLTAYNVTVMTGTGKGLNKVVLATDKRAATAMIAQLFPTNQQPLLSAIEVGRTNVIVG